MTFRTLSGLLLIGVAAVASAVVAFDDDGRARYAVAGSSYEIPRNWLFDARIAWLPAPEEDSFTFLLEPSPDADKIPPHRVLVQPLKRFCPGNASQMLRIACGLEDTSVGDGPPYERVRDKDSGWATNIFAVERGKRRQVAHCQTFEPNSGNPKGSTSCTTFWAHDDLLLQFSFDDTELGEMPSMKREAVQLLEGWKVR